MDSKALYNLTYGVFMISAKAEGKVNGCITDTFIQVAGSPARAVVSLLNTNYTCDLLKKSDFFSLSVLDETTTFETIAHWGLQSGRNVDKLANMELPVDANGLPYLSWSTCAVISCRITDRLDLGTHTLFIAEIVDAKVTSDRPPLTYADYQNRIKPKNSQKKEGGKIKGWKCRICGYVFEGAELPLDFTCPLCGHPREDFEPIYE